MAECEHEYTISVNAKCSDLCGVILTDNKEKKQLASGNGYVPDGIGGDSDCVDLKICIKCKKVLDFPDWSVKRWINNIHRMDTTRVDYEKLRMVELMTAKINYQSAVKKETYSFEQKIFYYKGYLMIDEETIIGRADKEKNEWCLFESAEEIKDDIIFVDFSNTHKEILEQLPTIAEAERKFEERSKKYPDIYSMNEIQLKELAKSRDMEDINYLQVLREQLAGDYLNQ